MDPNANIARQRELAVALIADPEERDYATELAELVQALDEWRLKGGFDPYGAAAESEAMTTAEQRKRLEYLRGQLRRECISWGELHELQGLAEHIEPGDVELLEAAGVPEFPEEED